MSSWIRGAIDSTRLPRPTVFQDRRLHAFLALRKDARIHFEVAFALVVLLGAVILVWSLRITVKALKDRRHSWGLTDESDFSQSQLRPPQAAEILKRAFANIVYFLLGCALFVVEGQRFFRKNLDDSGTGYIMVLVFPLLFGCAGVLRIFMAAARSHLYFSSLRHGLLLELRVVKLSGEHTQTTLLYLQTSARRRRRVVYGGFN